MGKTSLINRFQKWLDLGGNSLALFIFSAMTLLPVIESFSRFFNLNNIPASQILVQHLTLWIGFFGAVLATRDNKLLSLTREPLFQKQDDLDFGQWIAKLTTLLISFLLFLRSK